MPTLFTIGADLLALNDLLEEAGGELVDDRAEAAVTAWFAELADGEAVKMDGYCGLVRSLEGEIAVAWAEAEQFTKKARTRETRVAWLKGRLKQHLEATGRTKVTTAAGRVVAVQANGGRPPLLIDDVPITAVPVQYRRVVETIDREAVAAAVAAGEPLPFARFGVRGTQLRIR